MVARTEVSETGSGSYPLAFLGFLVQIYRLKIYKTAIFTGCFEYP
jgi:hypothetical protein